MNSIKTIKNYIYIDEKLINSYLSQIFEGNTNQIQLIENLSKQDTNSETIKTNPNQVTSTLNTGFLKGSIAFNEDSIEESISQALYETTGQNITKVIDAYYKIDKLTSAINLKEDKNIIEITNDMQILNLEQYYDILSDPLMKETANTTIGQLENKNVVTGKQKNKKVRLTLIGLIRFIRLIFPIKLIIYSDEYIIPILTENLFYNPKLIQYKAKNPLTILGRVVEDFKEINTFESKSGAFCETDTSINDLINIFIETCLGINIKEAKILEPIAIYSQFDVLLN